MNIHSLAYRYFTPRQENRLMPTTLNINGKDVRGRRRRIHPHPLGPARHAGHDRHQVRLRRGAVRRLHRAPQRRGHPLLRHADCRGRGPEDHHHRSRGDRPRRPGRAAGLGQARRGPVRLLPERSDHERHRTAQGQPETQRCRHRRAPWPATSAAAAPTRACASPSRTRPARWPERTHHALAYPYRRPDPRPPAARAGPPPGGRRGV